MNEGSNHIPQIDSDRELETAAATAVQRLIADRNNLRNRLASEERELAASRAAQEDLKRRLGILHQRYIELARNVVSQLEQFDGILRDALRERPQATNGEAENLLGSKRQFDSSGLRMGPQPPSSAPDGFNGTAHGNRPLPLEP